jgi:hypothetical protein
LRIEHPQELIDRGRYGGAVRELGAASYGLLCKSGDGLPAAYSFCMCPGGRIVASVNEVGLLCTNGMSNSKTLLRLGHVRDRDHLRTRTLRRGRVRGRRVPTRSRSALLRAGGVTTRLQPKARAISSTGARARTRGADYPFGTRPGRLDLLLPPLARDAIARALWRFDQQIAHFASNEGQFVGLESRSSGPVRMPRDPHNTLRAGSRGADPTARARATPRDHERPPWTAPTRPCVARTQKRTGLGAGRRVLGARLLGDVDAPKSDKRSRKITTRSLLQMKQAAR